MEKMIEKHRDFFRDLFKLKEGEQIPAHVVRLYETTRQLSDRKDILLSDQLLLMIAMLSGEVLSMSNLVASIPRRAKKPEPAPVQEKVASKPETVEKPKEIKVAAPQILDGVPCTAFHNGETKSGVLLNIEEDELGMCSVIFAGDNVPTLVDTNNVKLPDSEGKTQCLNQHSR